MSRYFQQIGLTWRPVKYQKRTMGAYRMDALRDFLIKLNDYYADYINNPDSPYVFVFTDESYVHQTHAQKHTWGGKETVINRSASKGQRLVLLHAITSKGPFCKKIDDYLVDPLTWKKEIPYNHPQQDGKLTAECMWKASQKTGDYHLNMNSEMFMKWVKNKLIPTFEK
jgi:hypothetical protein